jgi:basic membrane protein A and related proteins
MNHREGSRRTPRTALLGGGALALAVALASAGTSAAAPRSTTASCTASSCKVALIISDAGLGDKGFNDLGLAGIKKATSEFSGLSYKSIQDPQIDTHCAQVLSQAAQAGFGLVINLNYGCQTALEAAAKQFPKVKFVMVDNVAKGSNVTSEMFDVQDSSFLAGAASAMLNQTKTPGINGKHTIGAIGGVKSPGIDQFLVGYQQGAQYIDKSEKMLLAYANSFADPSKGAALTNSMFSQGATVVYQVAGVTGLGGIKAAKAKKLWAVGVDSNQDGLAPGHVLTSSIKHTDTAVYQAAKLFAQGKLPGAKTLFFGLANGGVAITPMQYTKNLLTAADRAKLQAITKAIISGKLKVWNVPTQGYPKWWVGKK